MHVSVIRAETQVTDLIRRAQAGEDVVLISGDGPPVRLVPTDWDIVREHRRRVLEEFRGVLKGKPGLEGVTAANIADDLYDEDGLPA